MKKAVLGTMTAGFAISLGIYSEATNKEYL